MAESGASVYRFRGAAGDLLYVGATSRFAGRLVEHGSYRAWWPLVVRIDVEHFPSIDEARQAEAAAIAGEGPQFNIVGTGQPAGALGPHRRRHGEGSIYQRHDGRWAAVVTENGRQRTLYCGRSRDLAEGRLAAYGGSE